MKVTKKRFLRDFESMKDAALYYFENNDVERCVEAIYALARIAYELNIVYTDDKVEQLLTNIGNRLIDRKKMFDKSPQRWVFYDSFGWDNRGLTQQYLRAMQSWGVEILFIFENYNEKLSEEIVKDLNSYGAQIYYVNNSLTFRERVQSVYDKVVAFGPENAFLHFSPWTVLGFVLWNSLNGINRYFINLTDHAFWLGKNTFDICIEFRNYGYTVSRLQRRIADEQLVVLPYYPIVDENNSFQGFPVDTAGKKIVVSGSSFYKVFGEDDQFFRLLKLIVDRNKDVIVFFAGEGDREIFNKLIGRYNLEGKVILIGNRTDISEVIKQADVYLATYPITGGLMGQFAIKNEIATIGFTDKAIPCNYIESLVELQNNVQLTYFDEQSFINEFDQLLSDDEYRQDKIDLQKGSIKTAQEFNKRLYDIVYHHKHSFKKELIDIDFERFYKIYLTVNNNYNKFYYKFLIKYNRLFFKMKTKIIFNYYWSHKKQLLKVIKGKL